MNESSATPTHLPRETRRETAIFLALAVLVCAAAISTQSYWIDEAVNVYRATLPTLSELWRFLKAEGNANLQVPLYYLFSWAWEKLTGPNEFAMRAGNALWFLLGLVVLLKALKGHRALRLGITLALLVSPFAWYYLDEARPYALQLSVSLLVFAALFRLGLSENSPPEERRWIIVLCVGSVLLAASGLLAMLWLGSYLAGAALSSIPGKWKGLIRSHWSVLVPSLVLLFLLGLYYLWTLSLGARATGGKTDLKTILFVPYELFGFSGLGPGRLTLRENGPAALRDWLPLLGIYGMVLFGVLVAGWRNISKLTTRRTRLCWGVAFFAVAVFIFAMCVSVKFRVLGRHCMPLLPLVVALLGAGIGDCLQQKRLPGRLLFMAFIGLSLTSALSLRFSQRHAKDDYRDAAAMAREALRRGEVVWWNAAKDGALVYQLAVTEAPGASRAAICLMNPTPAALSGLPRPDLILTSKSDVYDIDGTLRNHISVMGFRPYATFVAFTAWRPPAKP